MPRRRQSIAKQVKIYIDAKLYEELSERLKDPVRSIDNTTIQYGSLSALVEKLLKKWLKEGE